MISLENLSVRSDVEISLCTFVTDWTLYRDMVARFKDKGFTENCEYVYIDNSEGNSCSAFSGINEFLNRANGQISIVLHQDVHPIDDHETFNGAILRINQLDPNWAILGNAGYDRSFRSIRYISSPSGFEQFVGDRRIPVESLDENFLIFNMAVRPSVSWDLDGFHLYGTDAVQIAKLRGLKSYVIDYHLDHFGTASVDGTFLKTAHAIEKKYSLKRRWLTVKTTVTYLAIGGLSLRAWRHRKRLARRVRTGQKRSSFSRFRSSIARHLQRIRLQLSGSKVSFNGKKYYVPIDIPTNSIRALDNGTYESEVHYFVNSHLDRDVPIVELGGSYGIVSSQIAKRLRGRQKHIIVEAIPDLVPIIEKNIGAKSPQNTYIHNAAIAYERQVVEFQIDPIGNYFQVSSGSYVAAERRCITAPTVTLQKLLRLYELSGDYCLLCDIGGDEFELFKREPKALERCILAIVKFQPTVFSDMRKSTVEFFELLEAAGFSIVERRGSVIVAKRI